MNKYGLRFLYKNLGKVIKKLPFQITHYGKVVAMVVKPEKEVDEVYNFNGKLYRVIDRKSQVFNVRKGRWESCEHKKL